MIQEGFGKASGKIILIGEHAVVYGQGAIALPFSSVSIDTKVVKIESGIYLDSQFYKGSLDEAPEILKGIKHLIGETLKYLAKEDVALSLIVTSSLPAQRGLGSSAAVSVSIVKALFDYFSVELNNNLLRELVFHAEKIHHSNPSGLDVFVISEERALYFKKDKQMDFIDLDLDAYLVVADTGTQGQTRAAVDSIKMRYNNDSVKEAIHDLGLLTDQALLAIYSKDLKGLGKIMSQAQEHLKFLGVSNDRLDKFVQKALAAGSLGSKLTGSGMGGCMISLCPDLASAKSVSMTLGEETDSVWIMNLKEL